MLKNSAQFSSKFQTFENQFEQGSGRFVDPEPPFKNGTTNSSRTKKNKNTKKRMSSMKPNAYFCRKEPFWNQKKVVFSFDGLGRLKKKKRKPQIADVQKTLQNKGFCSSLCLFLDTHFLPKTTLQQNKTTYTK